jgi:glycosyltransferase involved in cell wall biosynthesis
MSSGVSIPSYFEEEAYLYYNPDVADAVAAGAVESGYHHWLFYGSGEPRRGAPWRYAIDRKVFTSRFEKRPYGVNLFGFLSTPSGLGEAARSCQAGLQAAGIPVHAIDVPPWHLTDAPRVAPPPEERYRINVIQQNADMMRSFIKAYGEEVFHGAYNIPFWFWELPSMLPDWFPYYDYADEIWVASEFCRRSISSMTRLPVVRMPLVIEGLEKRLAYGREHFGLPAETFLFGYAYDVNSYVDRKNPLALIEAFRREFADSPNVLLVLKQSYGGAPKAEGADRIAQAISGAANIRILDGDLDESEITSFQNVLDCFVSPHRTEGFGFNLAESMYLQKPVIATAYSGNVDFMNGENSYLLDYRLVPIKHTAGPYKKGSMWADPDVDHLRSLMRRVVEDREERERKAAEAAASIRRDFSSAAAGRAMKDRFEELGLNQPRVQRSLFSQHSMRSTPLFVHPDTPDSVRQEVCELSRTPIFSVIPKVPEAQLRSCIESVRSQWYPYWELCLATSAHSIEDYHGVDPRLRIAAGAAPIELSTGEYLVFIEDAIAPDVLLRFAQDVGHGAVVLDGAMQSVRVTLKT